MKRNRMMIKRKKRRGTMVVVTLFCIILPIIAIYAGLRITELWVSPALNSDYNYVVEDDPTSSNENTDDTNGNGEDISEGKTDEDTTGNDEGDQGQQQASSNLIKKEIQPLSIYTIQIASLTDNKTVDGLIEELNERKLSNLIYKVDNTYKVYVVGATKREPVEKELEHVRTFYPDAYINEVHPPAKIIEYPEGEKVEVYGEIVQDINKIIELIDQQGEEWYNFYEKEGELGPYIELLKKQQQILKDLDEKVKEVELPKSFPVKALIEKMVVYQDSNINRSIEILNEGKEENLHKVHSLYLDSLFRVAELTK